MSEEGPYSPHTPPEPHTPYHAPPPEPDEIFDIRGTLRINKIYNIHFPNEETPKQVQLIAVDFRWAHTVDNNKWESPIMAINRNTHTEIMNPSGAGLVFKTLYGGPNSEKIWLGSYYFLDSSGVSIQKHVIGHRGDRTGAATLTLSDAVKSRGIRIAEVLPPAPMAPGYGGRRRRNTRKRRSKRSKKTRKHVRR